jgi:tetratricopeptide (TPR) repeat protein
MTKKISILFLCFSISLFASAQSASEMAVADSLKKVISMEKQDTSKAKTLFLLSKTYSDFDPNLSIKYLNQATELLANTPNDRILSDITNQLGNNYYYLGDFNNSLKYFLVTLKICERRNNFLGIATAHNNIGSIYFELSDTTNALIHHLEALKIRKKYNKNDKNSNNEIAMSYGNVGKAYFAKSNYTKALEYYQLSFNLSKELGNRQREALMLNNIGSVLAEQGKYDEAHSNFTEAYTIYLEADNSEKIALCLNNIAEIHYRRGEYQKSVEHYKKSIAYSEKVSALPDIKTSYEGLKNCYIQLNDYKQAFTSLQKYFAIRDSIFSEENTAQLNELLTKFDSDKKEQEIKLLQKQKQMSSWLRNSLIASSVLLVFFAFALYSRNKVKQKANVELLAKNKNIEAQKQIVDEQKLKLEVHQKEIIDSFNYAKRIQYALLANENLLTKNLPSHFVYFNPKDIVSGDFYWATEDENYFYLAVCDCTGHGVPEIGRASCRERVLEAV